MLRTVSGFANGICDYDEISEYTDQCNLQNARCDVDVNECDSSPCQNGAVCRDSTTDPTISVHAYRCTCSPGFTNGFCVAEFNSEFLTNYYQVQCSVMESSSNQQMTGNCDIDIDECVSSPCTNGAACDALLQGANRTDSFPAAVGVETYRCTCLPGFVNGVCEYGVLGSSYQSQCASLDATCDVDVDECHSAPCQNAAQCTDSSVDGDISPHSFRCSCNEGFTSGLCNYDFIPEYSVECTLRESSQNITFVGDCGVDLDECRSNPCQHDGICRDSNSPDPYVKASPPFGVSNVPAHQTDSKQRCCVLPGPEEQLVRIRIQTVPPVFPPTWLQD